MHARGFRVHASSVRVRTCVRAQESATGGTVLYAVTPCAYKPNGIPDGVQWSETPSDRPTRGPRRRGREGEEARGRTRTETMGSRERMLCPFPLPIGSPVLSAVDASPPCSRPSRRVMLRAERGGGEEESGQDGGGKGFRRIHLWADAESRPYDAALRSKKDTERFLT